MNTVDYIKILYERLRCRIPCRYAANELKECAEEYIGIMIKETERLSRERDAAVNDLNELRSKRGWKRRKRWNLYYGGKNRLKEQGI